MELRDDGPASAAGDRRQPNRGAIPEAATHGILVLCAHRSIATGAFAVVWLSLLLAACGQRPPSEAPGAGNAQIGLDDSASPAELESLSSAYMDISPEVLRHDPAALATGAMLYEARCAACHGDDGHGSRGVPDLAAGRFSYGASADAIRATIRDGRHSVMPAMGQRYGEVDLGEIVSYLETLDSNRPLSAHEERGKSFFIESCAVCHGQDGRGQTELGAPDLSDDHWDHGDSMMNIRLAITRGTESVCPAQGESLTPTQIELLTAYTLELANL